MTPSEQEPGTPEPDNPGADDEAPDADLSDPAARGPVTQPVPRMSATPESDEQPTAVLPRGGSDETPTVLTGAPPVWHQPPPDKPWHARHEKPGEWQHPPPEHLAHHHSPPAEVSQRPPETSWQGSPPQPPPWQIPLAEPPAQRRGALWVSLATVATVLLCAGGAVSAYLLLRDADTAGSPDPVTAVNRFMTAVFIQQDAATAGDLVCRESRDEQQLTDRVNQVKGYADEYDSPAFRWSQPAVATTGDERATVTVQLTMTTEDEKLSQQQLTFTTVRKSGWLVCEIAG
ncbi:Rv0361 family membrane protein [Mangrovihabitans endophyticus]|uniref:Ig-like domain-containing protein n=1 Tax=Mangrovihabitans endophyticus TaxID=1751298 RepID=A0A8J3C204_9ACTN|nr:hypothetical protein [Mangrovihabitans endophyticus]GGL03589.1 hypothetical protein GCM10012284_42720 [Mangrovihabitans endophyticus]